jgi:hypothetical protein
VIDWNATYESILAALFGLGAMGVIARQAQQRYFPDLFKSLKPAPERSTDSPSDALKGEGSMIRVYELLRGYVTRDTCDAKHEGLCSKLDMMQKAIDEHHEEQKESTKTLFEKLDRMNETLMKHCQEKG